MRSDQLILGIDGGGTKTVAWLAACGRSQEPEVVGRGVAGGANPQAVGWERALENLGRAIAAAFDDAAVPSGPVAAAVLGLAGSDRDENREALQRWAEERSVARRFRVVHDALPVLAAGSPDGWGVALICGTGSLAFGRDRSGQTARAGGWGYLFGDEGSGYAIARAALLAAAKAADGRGPQTQLLAALLNRLELRQPADLVAAVYEIASDPAAIASLADVVTETAGSGDPTAQRIIDEAAGELAAMVIAVAKKLQFADTHFPVALAGGVLLGDTGLHDCLQTQMAAQGLRPDPIVDVHDPVRGALRLAQLEAARK